MRILGIDGLTREEIDEAVAEGGRFVFFEYCISCVVFTLRRPSDICFVRGDEWGWLRGLPYTLVTLLVGWWGLPWGFIYTPLALVTNIAGGCDVTYDTREYLASQFGWDADSPEPLPCAESTCAGFALLLIAPATVCAGLYIPGEPPELPLRDGRVEALSYELFRIRLNDVIGIGMNQPEPTPLREHYLKRRTELSAKESEGLPVPDLVTLSGYQMRLGEFQQAVRTLQAARVKDRRNFQLESHWAFQTYVFSRDPSAVNYQYDVSKTRVKELPGMKPEQVAFALRCEQVLYELMKARLKERRQHGDSFQPESPDALFPIQFVGESGTYEAGRVAASQKEKLPADAIVVVQQLLLWLPADSRLYWLLAELYNANGDIESAATILDTCVDAPRSFQPDSLKSHRRVLKDELTRRREERVAEAARQEEERQKADWRNHPEVFWIIGAVGAIPLALLLFWQIRVIRKRLHGDCPTGH